MRAQRFLKRSKIDGVCSVLRGKVAADQLTVVIFYCFHEGIVDRCKNKNFISRCCHRLQKPVDRRNNTRCDAQPLALDDIVVHILFPLYKGIKVGI